MLSSLAFLLASATVTIEPSDDIWVYQHAQAQSADPFLRAWGIEGRDLADEGEGVTATSWSVMKFDLTKLPKGTITGAKLVLTAPGDVGYIADETKETPIFVRSAPAKFEEESFQFADAETVFPPRSKSPIFGKASPIPSADQNDFKVEIDLMGKESKFAEEVKKALATPNNLLGLALTSGMDPQTAGDGAIYKFYSRNAEETKRPKLILTIE